MSSSPDSAFHDFAVLSSEHVNTCCPSTLTATDSTLLVWPRNVARCSPVPASHDLAVSSYDAVNSRRPSVLTATDRTLSPWPENATSSSPEPTRQAEISYAVFCLKKKKKKKKNTKK
eukprot:NODE_25340_length_590_cov_77.477322.p1 GENE.NODE_25340_length_590_cov_77.477322~~NODE_25340_length_590_cov_77.477322.p1  ORF type:complete len:117 (-),score=29.79 NODE_25340_length_590_cov_77.477322:81-431(-)